MKIEAKPIALNPFQIFQNGDTYQLKSQQSVVNLSKQQFSYFDHISHGKSLEQLIQIFLQQGWLVSFRDLYFVMEQLIQNNLIKDSELIKYWAEFKIAQNYSAREGSDFSAAKATGQELSHWPFFRTLNSQTQKLFQDHLEILSVPSNRLILKTGATDRDLYYLVKGHLGIYRVNPTTMSRSLVTRVQEGSVVGEGGFFLGKARSADVVTLTDCVLARIKYNSNDFDFLIKSDKAQALQKRFWILNAIMSSDTLSDLPEDSIDSLIFAGHFVEVQSGQRIFEEGSQGQSFYIIVQGSVVFNQGPKTIRVLQQGSIFGEVALMVSGGRRTATAVAQAPSLLLEINMKDFYQILARNLFLAKEIETLAWNRFHNKSQK